MHTSLRVLMLALSAMLSACSGGSVSTDTVDARGTTSTSFTTDTVDAGYKRFVIAGVPVTLNGSAADDAADQTWAQLDGTPMTLIYEDSVTTSFTSPTVTSSEILIFELSVSDGTTLLTDTVCVEVHVAEPAIDATSVADFSGRNAWQCVEDPAYEPEVTIEESGGYLVIDSNAPVQPAGSYHYHGLPGDSFRRWH